MSQLAVRQLVPPACNPPHAQPRPFTIRHAGAMLGLVVGLLAPSHGLLAVPPKLASVTPADGSTGAGSTTPLIFTFDQPMDTTVPYFPTSPGVPLVGNFEFLPANFALQVSGTWSADGRTLTVRPNLTLSLNQTFNWKLNPAGTLFPNKSKTGELLATVAGSYTTGPAAPAPQLVSATPAPGALGVPVNTTVVFAFDQVMRTNTAIAGAPPAIPAAVSWNGSEVNAAKFTYQWATDSKSLLCSYAGGLPAGTTVSWILNPVTAPVKLEGVNGRPLASGAYTGNFSTVGGLPVCDPDGVPDTWGQYSVFKSTQFQQAAGADPVPATEDPPASFSAVIFSPQFGPFVTAGSLTLPAGSVSHLTVIGGLGQLITAPATEAALNTAFPAGNYTLRFTQNGQPERVIALPLPASAPPIPKIANLAAAQAIPAGSNFTLQWNAFTGAQAEDLLFLSIEDGQGNVLFEAPDVCLPRPLGVGATSIVIPAGTLVSNTTYTARLTFSDVFHRVTNSVPEMAGFAGVNRSTQFTVKTAGPTLPPPVAAMIQAAQVLPSGQLQFVIVGSASRLYAVQRTPTLSSPTWIEVGSLTLDATGRGTFSDLPSSSVPTNFYRVVGQ